MKFVTIRFIPCALIAVSLATFAQAEPLDLAALMSKVDKTKLDEQIEMTIDFGPRSEKYTRNDDETFERQGGPLVSKIITVSIPFLGITNSRVGDQHSLQDTPSQLDTVKTSGAVNDTVFLDKISTLAPMTINPNTNGFSFTPAALNALETNEKKMVQEGSLGQLLKSYNPILALYQHQVNAGEIEVIDSRDPTKAYMGSVEKIDQEIGTLDSVVGSLVPSSIEKDTWFLSYSSYSLTIRVTPKPIAPRN
jgi:hypothetical protein